MKETLYKGKQHAAGSFYSKCSLSWDYCFSAAKGSSQMQGSFPFSCRHNFPCPSVLPQVLFMALWSIQFGGSRWKVNKKKSNYSCGEFNKAKVERTVKTFQYVWLRLGSARLSGDPTTKLRWERWRAIYCRVDVEIWPHEWSLVSKQGTRSRENRADGVPP